MSVFCCLLVDKIQQGISDFLQSKLNVFVSKEQRKTVKKILSRIVIIYCKKIFLKIIEQELLMLSRLERVTKDFLKSLDSISRPSGRCVQINCGTFNLSGTLCVSGRPTKITLRARCVIV